jgi:osmotically-inducible protein OsmY
LREANHAAVMRSLKQVLAAFEHESHRNLHSHPIDTSFSGGALTVAGEVPDIASKKRIVHLAHSLGGATELVDHLPAKVESPLGDGALRDSVRVRLLQAADFRNCVIRALVKGQVEMLRGTMDAAGNGDGSGAIEVTVQDGVVTLTGQVISLSHRRLAGVLAWWAGSCREVVNLLDVFPVEEDSDDEIAEAMHLVLETDPCVRADQIVTKSQNHRVTGEGWVSSEAERRQAEQDAWYLDAIDQVVNRIGVRA